jgi:copper homeostasis protein
MIRIRRGDFDFSNDELDAMIEDVKYFKLKNVDGIVIGCLNSESEINVEFCEKLISAWGDRNSVTFHRAFDETKVEDFKKNLKVISDMGITRILTSGFESSAEKGIENLKQLVEEGKLLNITIMPGAGINSSNVSKILDETTCEEIHASARSPMKFSNSIKLSMGGGKDDLNPLMICDIEKAKHLKNAIQNKI